MTAVTAGWTAGGGALPAWAGATEAAEDGRGDTRGWRGGEERRKKEKKNRKIEKRKIIKGKKSK